MDLCTCIFACGCIHIVHVYPFSFLCIPVSPTLLSRDDETYTVPYLDLSQFKNMSALRFYSHDGGEAVYITLTVCE